MSLKHYLGNFAGFTGIGALFYILAVILNWIAIDVVGGDPYIAPFAIISVLFILKYIAYVKTRTIVSGFCKFLISNSMITIACTYMIGILVSRYNLKGGVASAASIAFFTLIRYAILYLLGVIRRPEKST